VSLNFAGDGAGGDIVVLSGTAVPQPDAPPADGVANDVAKYREAIPRIGLTRDVRRPVQPSGADHADPAARSLPACDVASSRARATPPAGDPHRCVRHLIDPSR
jgi:hypothetical protein